MINFEIKSGQKVSSLFRAMGIPDFAGAAGFIRRLPYKRNENKQDLITVFSDNCGTCSTKHALLKLLADENGQKDVRLMLGIFKMKAANTPKIRATLEKYGLAYIPEAHNYLRSGGEIADFTFESSFDFENDLLAEEEITSGQIAAYKVAYHRDFLKGWLANNKAITYGLDEIWAIRERCIFDLAH